MNNSMAEKACDGGRVMEAPHDMAECIACGTTVRWDLRDHPFWGFGNCREKSPIASPETHAKMAGNDRSER